MSKQQQDKRISALYERLSRDDELQGPSNSIINQQYMLEEYAGKHGFGNLVHYTDDGISGTRFDRPGFLRLMDDIDAGKVAVVLVKDTSRIGRDYIRVGLFLEKLREREVRLIAIGDGVDTAGGEDEFMPFRNIIHEMYARDTSRKIKSVIRSKGMSGKPISTHAPYGYLKSADDKHCWVVDPVAAEVVRRIFSMTLEGFGPAQIAYALSADRVEIPSYHLAQMGLGHLRNRVFVDPYG